MQRSTDRIYTTHVGSLARPAALLDLMRASAAGEPVEEAELDAAHRRAVADVVARQRAAGIDVINDGEQGKTGFFAYIAQRLSGYEPRAGGDTLAKFRPELEEFPEYYEQYFRRAMTGGMAVPAASLACTGRCPTRAAKSSPATCQRCARRSATRTRSGCSSAPWRRAASAATSTTAARTST